MIIKLVLIERLHRYIFDNYYKQNYKITFFNKFVIKIYYILIKNNHDWRYELIKYSKTFDRYSNITRNQKEIILTYDILN